MPTPPDFPSTRFLCDVVRYQMKAMTKDQIRAKWKAGEYAGVCPKWAAEQLR